MLTLNIDNPAVENYFHQNADEMYEVLEAVAMSRAKLVSTENTMPQAAMEIMRDVEAYRRGELKTMPFEEGVEEMRQKLISKYENQ